MVPRFPVPRCRDPGAWPAGRQDPRPGGVRSEAQRPGPDRPDLPRRVGAVRPPGGLLRHAAGLVVLTPEGRIARYFYGIDFPAKDLQFGLIEASAGRIGTPIARLLLLCYDYDAAAGKYTLAIVRLLRVLGSATALALGTY